MNYALIDSSTGIVINIEVWEGDPSFDPAEGTFRVASEIAQIGDVFADGEFTRPPTEIPAPVPSASPMPMAVAMANLAIDSETAEVNGIETAIGIGFALYVEPGRCWCFFSNPQPDTNYIAIPGSDVFRANVAGRTVDYVEITVTDDLGTLADPASLTLAVYRGL